MSIAYCTIVRSSYECCARPAPPSLFKKDEMHLVFFKPAGFFFRKCLCLADVRVTLIFVGIHMRAKHKNIIHSLC